MKPEGLYHTKLPYSNIRMIHEVILLHQEAFPELAKQMKENPNNATNIYGCFLALIPLQVKGLLTEEKRVMILKSFKMM